MPYPKAARKALHAYTRTAGRVERRESDTTRAKDLITDLLLTFDHETAEAILGEVERDYYADHETALDDLADDLFATTLLVGLARLAAARLGRKDGPEL